MDRTLAYEAWNCGSSPHRNTNVSRIKRKITDKLGKRAAEQYIIRRGEDGLYRISAQQM